MPTPSDSTGRQPAAKPAGPGHSSNGDGAPPDDDLPLARPGSTDSHSPLADLATKGSSSERKSPESDIAHFLANPHAVVGNTDDSPTVITKNPSSGSQPKPLPVIVAGEVPSIAGRKLGHYELIEAVGAGGMAAVLKAHDTELGRTVALKILPPEAARDPESVNRFKQEARAAAALDHENIARVYYCGEDQGLHFIAFEFVEGINLRQMIDRRGVLPAAECVRYMMQIAAGLHHAADRGVVHRDIKPSNILITPDGRAKIVDMGLARHLGSEAVNGGVTQSGVTLGTFDYISPEQALDPRRADVRSDIYSLGCTFYHALTGRPPVPEGTAARKLRAHQTDEPLDPRELNPAIPDGLAAILARMMAKNPDVRYQTPVELIAHLKGLAEQLHVADALAHDSEARMVRAESRLLPEPPGFRPWWVLAASAVCLAAAAFVVATSNPRPVPVPQLTDQTKKAPEPVVGLPPAPVTPVVQPTTPVRTAEELAQRLEDSATTRVVLAPGTFDLTKLDRPVVFQGKQLELIGAPLGSPDVITRVIVTAGLSRDAEGSLTIKTPGPLTVRNVWFELKLDPEVTVVEYNVSQPVGLRVEDAEQVTLLDCVFTGIDPGMDLESLKDHEPRAVSVTRGGTQLKLMAQRCLFAVASPRSVGLFVPPGSEVTLTDSGFAPHAAAVLIADRFTEETPLEPPPPPLTKVNLTHSTFMLNPGAAAVETGAPANVHVTAGDCLFAPALPSEGAIDAPIRSPFASSEANRRGVVVRVRADKPDGVQFTVPNGRLNGFHRVDPLGTATTTLSFEESKAALASNFDDKGKVELRPSPWFAPDPRAAVASVSPWKAFKLRVVGSDIDGALLTSESVNDKELPVPLGVAFHQPDGVRRAYPDIGVWSFSRPKAPVEARRLVWYPDAKDEELTPTVQRTLAALLEDVRPGDVILIRHNGELPRDTIELKPQTRPSDGEYRITFRPDRDCNPVLTVRDDAKLDRTLFRLLGGEVTFERIHFRLRPSQPKAGQTVAAVALLGGKSCTFRECTFTLAEEDDSKVAAVHLPNIAQFMAMTQAARQTPRVEFDRCLIRGKGRAVWVDASRPLTLEVTDSLTALDGPVFFVQAGGTGAGGATSQAHFTRVTALAGGPIVEMHGGKTADAMRPAGLPKLEVETEACLFVAVPFAGRPLLELNGIDPAELKSVLEWHVNRPNRFAGFDSSANLAVIAPGEGELPKTWRRSEWIDNTGEPPPDADKRFGEVKLAEAIPELKELATVDPADVVVKRADFPDLMSDKPLDVGVDTAKLKNLPPPAEPKPE